MPLIIAKYHTMIWEMMVLINVMITIMEQPQMAQSIL